MECQVFISGGGIAGLTLALKLVQRGVSVIVAEKEEVPSVKYKGELIQPKSIDILTQLGLHDQIHSISHRIYTTNLEELSGKSSRITFQYSMLEHPYNYALMTPHEPLKKIILNEAQKYEHFHYMNGTFVDFKEQELIKKTAIVKIKDGELQEIHAQFFIGAEGRVSPVRKSLQITLKDSTYNHHFLTVSFPRPDSLTEGEMRVNDSRFLGLFPLQNTVRSVFLIKPEEYKLYRKAGLQKLFDSYIELFPDIKGYVEQIPDWKSIQLMIPVRHSATQYVKGNCALIGDSAHSVHPMAGEGMNLAIQDTDVLGELLSWMFETGQLDSELLHWYEDVRKPRAEFLSAYSHLSALAYSYSNAFWRIFRSNVLYNMSTTKLLHFKQMLNISGLGIWKETIADRLTQGGLLPKALSTTKFNQQDYFFTREDDYPWYR